MRSLLLLALVAVAAPVRAQEEDAAHRADREVVRRLNRLAARPATGPAAVAPADQRAYRRATEDYQQRLADWRARVAACEAGRYEACQ